MFLLQFVFVSVLDIKMIKVILLSSVKFLFSPSLAIYYGFDVFETIAITAFGGILGVFFFYYLSHFLILFFNKYIIILPIFEPYYQRINKNKIKKKFTRKNKIIVITKTKYGLIGILVATPVLLSIPLGAFLAKKYYGKINFILLYFMISVVFWAIVITFTIVSFEYILDMLMLKFSN